MIVSGPFSMEINLKIVGIQLVNRAVMDAAGHSEELLVINNVELWGEVVGAKIADETNRGRVVAREAKKLAKASARAPLGDFVAVLEFGIQDIGRAAKNLQRRRYSQFKRVPQKSSMGARPLSRCGVWL